MRFVIKSPMCGTFYSRPKPDSRAFAETGDFVTSATVVCVIETGNIYHPISAGVEGWVVDVLFEGDMRQVDRAEPLFAVESSDPPETAEKSISN